MLSTDRATRGAVHSGTSIDRTRGPSSRSSSPVSTGTSSSQGARTRSAADGPCSGPCVREERCTVIRSPLCGAAKNRCSMDIEGWATSLTDCPSCLISWRARIRWSGRSLDGRSKGTSRAWAVRHPSSVRRGRNPTPSARLRLATLPGHPFRMDRAAEAWSAKHPPGASRLEHLPAVRAPPPRPVDRFVPLPGVARLDAVPVLHHGSALAAHQPNAARLHGQVRMRMWRYRAKASRSKSLVAMA